MPAQRTRRKAIFGAKMKQLRDASPARPEPANVADALLVSPTTVTRMEAGMTVPAWGTVLGCLALYQAAEAQIEEVKALWQAAKRPMVTVDNADDLPSAYVAFRRDEADAYEELSWQYTAIAGPLQDPKYAAALFQEEISDEEHPGTAEVRAANDRQARAKLLEPGHGLRVHALMDQMVLCRQVGGPGVLRGALGHLLDLAQLPNITIQIVPFSAGAWATMNAAVVILRFASDERDLAYLEHAGGGVTVENVPDVKRLIGIHERVAKQKAASPAESMKLIEAARDAV